MVCCCVSLPMPSVISALTVVDVWEYFRHKPANTTDQGFCPQRTSCYVLPAPLWTSCL